MDRTTDKIASTESTELLIAVYRVHPVDSLRSSLRKPPNLPQSTSPPVHHGVHHLPSPPESTGWMVDSSGLSTDTVMIHHT